MPIDILISLLVVFFLRRTRQRSKRDISQELREQIVSTEDNGIQEPDDNESPEHHRYQSDSESWNRKQYIITVVGVIVAILGLIIAILVFFFGDGILNKR